MLPSSYKRRPGDRESLNRGGWGFFTVAHRKRDEGLGCVLRLERKIPNLPLGDCREPLPSFQ